MANKPPMPKRKEVIIPKVPPVKNRHIPEINIPIPPISWYFLTYNVLANPKIEKKTKLRNTKAALSANAEKNRAMNDTRKPKTEPIIPKINSGVRLTSSNFDSCGVLKLNPQLLQKLAGNSFIVPHLGHFFVSSLFIFSPQNWQNVALSSIFSLHFGQFIIIP